MLIKRVNEEFIRDEIDDFFENEKLEIDDVFREIAKDYEGYTIPTIFGRTVIKKDTNIIKRLEFYPSIIIKEINKHCTFEQELLNDIAKCFVEFIVLHELKHIEQFLSGMTYEEYSQHSYIENPFEREANEYAIKKIQDKGSLSRWLLNFIPTKQKVISIINNDNREEIEKEYNKIKNKL